MTIDDDVLEAATRLAKARGGSIGRILSDLARRGLNAPTPSVEKHGVLVFRLPEDSPEVTSEDVRKLEAEGQ